MFIFIIKKNSTLNEKKINKKKNKINLLNNNLNLNILN